MPFAASGDAPLILPDAALLANDRDVDSPQLTVTSVDGAVGGAVERSGATVVFKPTARFAGDARFSYTVSDGDAASMASLTVTVAAVNHPGAPPWVVTNSSGLQFLGTTPP
jgi:hypothetical protein